MIKEDNIFRYIEDGEGPKHAGMGVLRHSTDTLTIGMYCYVQCTPAIWTTVAG